MGGMKEWKNRTINKGNKERKEKGPQKYKKAIERKRSQKRYRKNPRKLKDVNEYGENKWRIKRIEETRNIEGNRKKVKTDEQRFFWKLGF